MDDSHDQRKVLSSSTYDYIIGSVEEVEERMLRIYSLSFLEGGSNSDHRCYSFMFTEVLYLHVYIL